MGFQNKETNEYAINMLKTQPQKQQQQPPPPQINQGESYMAHVSQPARPQQTIQPIHMIPPMGNFIVASANIPPASIAPQLQTSYAWKFKVGDRCLAKYWEDENVSPDQFRFRGVCQSLSISLSSTTMPRFKRSPIKRASSTSSITETRKRFC